MRMESYHIQMHALKYPTQTSTASQKQTLLAQIQKTIMLTDFLPIDLFAFEGVDFWIHIQLPLKADLTCEDDELHISSYNMTHRYNT